MTSPYEGTGIERVRRAVGRVGYVLALVGLVAGTVLFLTGSPDRSSQFFRAAFCVLLVKPLINVLAVLAEEVARRDWPFIAIAAGALTVLTYAVAVQLL